MSLGVIWGHWNPKHDFFSKNFWVIEKMLKNAKLGHKLKNVDQKGQKTSYLNRFYRDPSNHTLFVPSNNLVALRENFWNTGSR